MTPTTRRYFLGVFCFKHSSLLLFISWGWWCTLWNWFHETISFWWIYPLFASIYSITKQLFYTFVVLSYFVDNNLIFVLVRTSNNRDTETIVFFLLQLWFSFQNFLHTIIDMFDNVIKIDIVSAFASAFMMTLSETLSIYFLGLFWSFAIEREPPLYINLLSFILKSIR